MKYGIRSVSALDAAVFHISEGWSEAVIEQRVTRDQARTKRLSRATAPLSMRSAVQCSAARVRQCCISAVTCMHTLCDSALIVFE